MSFSTATAGAFRVRTLKEGVVVDGWILNPNSASPVKVEARRGGATVRREAAKRSDPRSRARWPGFATRHGFRLVLPFVGKGGSYQVCLAAPGHSFASGSEVAGCREYSESARLFLENDTYTVGDSVRFTGEMLDPGARVRVNLLTSIGTFLVAWRYADFAAATADGNGHVAGQIPTRTVPPGTYRLALQCENGCSKIALWAPTPLGYPACCLPSPSATNPVPVSLGPSFRLTSNSNASVSVAVRDRRTLRVEASGLQPKAKLRVVLVIGAQTPACRTCVDVRDSNIDGLAMTRLSEAATATVEQSGRIRPFDLRTPSLLEKGEYMLWLVRPPDTVLAATQFTVSR